MGNGNNYNGNNNYNNNNTTNQQQKSTYVKIAGLYEKVNEKTGEIYFTGKLGDAIVELRINKFRSADTHPTHNLYIVDRPKVGNNSGNAGVSNNSYSGNQGNGYNNTTSKGNNYSGNNYNNNNNNNNAAGYQGSTASKPYEAPKNYGVPQNFVNKKETEQLPDSNNDSPNIGGYEINEDKENKEKNAFAGISL